MGRDRGLAVEERLCLPDEVNIRVLAVRVGEDEDEQAQYDQGDAQTKGVRRTFSS